MLGRSAPKQDQPLPHVPAARFRYFLTAEPPAVTPKFGAARAISAHLAFIERRVPPAGIGLDDLAVRLDDLGSRPGRHDVGHDSDSGIDR